MADPPLYWTYLSLSTRIGTTGESESKGEGRGREVKKVVTEKRDGSMARGKKGKKVAEFRGVNDELLFIKWRETYSGTIQKTEQGDSDLVLQSSQYLHSRRQPWNYTENGIVMSGPLKILVYSHYGAGKSLHPHIIPRKRREAGCVSAGTAARNERVRVTLMKRLILHFPVSAWKYSTYSVSVMRFTLRHTVL